MKMLFTFELCKRLCVKPFGLFLFSLLLPNMTIAQIANEKRDIEAKAIKDKKQASTKVAYVIETQVQGTQEQPNVIYITPWQESRDDVKVNKKILKVSLPALAPLKPKAFKKRVISFHQQTVKE